MAYRILVTDDNSDYRQIVIEILQLEEFDVIEAANGEKAVEKAITQKPELILCDVDMPLMDGFSVLEAVKSNPTTRHIPFFLVTGRADAASLQRGDELGADDYLLKPMNIDVLLMKIEQYLPKGKLTE